MSMPPHSVRPILAICLCLVLISSAVAQSPPAQYVKMSQDATPIPDVNKVNPSDPNDGSCWLAVASNLLGAAGYGNGGMGAAQARAQSIYNQLTIDFGILGGGAPDQAISYWLAMYGKNPGSPDYMPTLSYTDVTGVFRALGQADYTFLKNELYRCQYVGVQFDNPAHAMTLVGWDDMLGQSIWHDSDNNISPPGNDVYANAFSTVPLDWDLNQIIGGATYMDHANGYVTLCPGLNKTQQYVENYDIAWVRGPAGFIAREAGAMKDVHDDPTWMPTWTNPGNNKAYEPFHIDNQLDPNKQKRVELLVDFFDRSENYVNEDILLRYLDSHGQLVLAQPTKVQASDDNGQVLFTWELDNQPDWEEILFPSMLDYYMLDGTVASWDVAVYCVPEPATLGLLALGGLALPMLRRRRN